MLLILKYLDNPQLDRELRFFPLTTIEELADLTSSTQIKLSSNHGVLLPVICKIVNLSLEQADYLEKAVLLPHLKKSSLDHQGHHWITILKMISKVNEKVVVSCLNHYLEENNVSDSFQSAYKRYHSCKTALLCALDSEQCVVLLTLDLSLILWTITSCFSLWKIDLV